VLGDSTALRLTENSQTVSLACRQMWRRWSKSDKCIGYSKAKAATVLTRVREAVIRSPWAARQRHVADRQLRRSAAATGAVQRRSTVDDPQWTVIPVIVVTVMAHIMHAVRICNNTQKLPCTAVQCVTHSGSSQPVAVQHRTENQINTSAHKLRKWPLDSVYRPLMHVSKRRYS